MRRTAALIATTLAATVLTATPADAARDWRPCKYEDGSGMARCVWDARHMGDGKGQSFKVFHGGQDDARYVDLTHRRAHRLLNR